MIDEKKLIEELKKWQESLIERDAINDVLDTVTDIAMNNIPKVGEWISAAERLPDELAPVNVTWVNKSPESYYNDIKDKPFTATGVLHKGRWYWDSATCVDILREYGESHFDKIDNAIEITAWMPLPEPYEEETE